MFSVLEDVTRRGNGAAAAEYKRFEQLDQKAKDEFLSLQLFIRRSCLVIEVDQSPS